MNSEDRYPPPSLLIGGRWIGAAPDGASEVRNPDSPAGGRRDSGYGSEGGREGFESYLINKCVNEQ